MACLHWLQLSFGSGHPCKTRVTSFKTTRKWLSDDRLVSTYIDIREDAKGKVSVEGVARWSVLISRSLHTTMAMNCR